MPLESVLALTLVGVAIAFVLGYLHGELQADGARWWEPYGDALVWAVSLGRRGN